MAPRTRRPKGDGAIYFDENADRWVGQFDAGRTDTGKRRRVKVTGRTREQVAEKLKARRRAFEEGQVAPRTMTVGQLLDDWADATLHTRTPNTADQYRWSLRHLRPALGTIRLADLRAHHVERFLRSAAEGKLATSRTGRDGDPVGLNRTSLVRLRSNLGQALTWGQRRDLVTRNAAELAELPPAREAKEGRSLTRDEVAVLLAAAEGTRLEALWVVLAGVGLRPGEALGLTWGDVDLEEGVVHVRRSLKWREGAPVLGDLKTTRSRRSLRVPAKVVGALKAHRARQVEERLALRWPDEWAELVFVTEAGTPILMTNVRRTLDRLTADTGVGHVRPYDLRHTCASHMADAGVPLERVADFLGHDGIHMARLVYTHALSPTVEHGAEALEAMLGG